MTNPAFKPDPFYLFDSQGRRWKFARVSSEYIDVTPPEAVSPIEVINVYGSYATRGPDVPMGDRKANKLAAQAWLEENQDELTNYIENARY